MARTKQTVRTSGGNDSKKEEEKKRFDVEDRKEQELIDRRRQEALERSRRMEEQQRITKLQESKEKEDMEKSKRESEQSKLKLQEEKRKQKEEEERRQRVELELKKKLEDDKKRADDRRNKIEEERKKRIEEDKKKSEERRKAQEEELKRLEKLNADMLNNIANNDYSFLTSNNEFQTKSADIDKPSDFIDLLGGESDIESASDSESDGEYGISTKFQSRSQQQQRQDISRKSIVQPGSVQSQHRLAPQRGKIDEITDDYLDKLNFEVKLPLRKHGNRDGTYMYGMRIMKVTLINNRVPQVSAGKDNLSLEEFISKFEKVELTRRQGLESGLVVARMMMKNGNSITV